MNKRGGSPATFAGKLATVKDANNPAKIIKLRLIAIFVFDSGVVTCPCVCTFILVV